MSRPQSRASSGYFPTPPRIVEALSSILTNSKGYPGRLLDPCAGEGVAAGFLQRQLKVVDGYAIELNKQRAAQCRTRLTHVLRSDASVTKVQREAFNLLFLNPPYDSAGHGERTEYVWLKRWTPMLQPKGIGIYIIPEHQYSEQVLEYLSSYYREVSLYRFPKPEYDVFQQTVFIGTRVVSPNPSRTVRNQLWLQLRNKQLPTIGEAVPDRIYDLPDLIIRGAIQFHSEWLDPLDMYEAAHTQGLWEDRFIQDLLTFQHTKAVKPLLPLRIGHLTRLIISGMFNNQTIMQNGQHWIIKGRGRKQTKELPPLVEIVYTKEGPEERTQFRTMECYVPEIRAWNLTDGPTFGHYITINC